VREVILPGCRTKPTRGKNMNRAELVCTAVQRIARNRPEDDETGILARAVLELLFETERLGVGEQTLGTELMRTKLRVRRLKKKMAPRSPSVIRIRTKRVSS
jgi:methylphosphotriester-DNA--protein-cysteine methyltransferase